MEQLAELLQNVVASLARYWLDERGNSPFGRFLRPDSESLLPTRHIVDAFAALTPADRQTLTFEMSLTGIPGQV